MNQPKSNFHTHIYLCKHAEGLPEDYIKKALADSYHTIAITDHGPLVKELLTQFYTRRMTFPQYEEIYIPLMTSAKKKYHDQITVLSGLELEYFKEMETIYPLFLKEQDFLILGQHYYLYNHQYCSVYDKMSRNHLEAYVNNVITALNSGYFKMFAHPEIFLWGYQKWDKFCEKMAHVIIETAIENKVILEINANGIRNCLAKKHYTVIDGQLYYDYPNRHFWEIVKQYPAAKIVINDDAHCPDHFNDQFTKQAYQFAEALQLNIINSIF